MSLVSGWQGDVIPTATNQTIQVPVAKNPDGTSITGPLVLRFTGLTGTTDDLDDPARSAVALSARDARHLQGDRWCRPCPRARRASRAAIVKIAGRRLGVRRLRDDAVPGQARSGAVCVKNGFNPALLYELQYTAKDPLVLGIGFAATRDINSFFRYEKKDDAGTANPVAGRIRWAISEGSSQSGTFLRAYIHLGFNQDEQGRIVWDGSNPHIASRVIDMNRRFAMPGGTCRSTSWDGGAAVVGRLERHAARTRQVRPARSLPRFEHVPEDHGDVRQRRDLGAARLVDDGGHRRQGGHSAAGECSPVLFPGRDARRRARAASAPTTGAGAGGCDLPVEPGAGGADAIGAVGLARRLGDQRHADAAEQVSDDRRRHAGAEHQRGDGLPAHSRASRSPDESCPSDARLRPGIEFQLSGSVRLS